VHWGTYRWVEKREEKSVLLLRDEEQERILKEDNTKGRKAARGNSSRAVMSQPPRNRGRLETRVHKISDK